jgi:carbon monoxide dehydrogenase subunit G
VTTHVERSIEVAVPVRTAYNQWTQFEEFPQFMSGVQEVRQIGDALTHWVAEIAGVRREWDAAIVEQVPDQKVAWAATSGATNAGAVYFQAVGDERTQVRLTLDYEPEGFVERVADVLDVVERRAVADLDRFKEFIEQRGSATGGWRGRVDEGDVQAGATGEASTGGAGAGGIAGDVVSVGPTGDTRGTVTTEAGPARPSAAAESGEGPGVGHSGDPVVVQDRTVTGRADEDDAERTGTAAGAATSSAAGTAGFGTDTGLSSDDPASGVVTGNPDTGEYNRGNPQPAGTTERTGAAAGAVTSSAAGTAGFGTDTGLSSDDPASGVVTGNPDTSRTEGRDVAEPSAGFLTSYPGGNPAARAAEADEASAGFETGTPGMDRAARAADAEDSRAGFVTGYPGESTEHRRETADESGTNFLTGYPGERTASHTAGPGLGTSESAGGTWTDQPAARESATEAATDPVGEPWSSGTDVADRSRETGSATTGMGGARPSTADDPDDRQKPSV